MSGASSRHRGQRGEREVCKLLSEALGIKVNRDLSQARFGGSDISELEGWAIEVKFQEVLRLDEWWEQTLNQVMKDEQPILFFRKSRQPWKAQILLSSINFDFEHMPYTAIVDIDTAVMLIRETL